MILARDSHARTHFGAMLALLSLLFLSGCGGGGSSPGEVDSVSPRINVPAPSDDSDTLTPVVANARYSDELADCALVPTSSASCSLRTLPLLGMEVDDPSVQDIMERVVVSHDWMGTRFRQVLERMPPESLKLFKSITTIVISFDIRPSSYRSVTSAIYLDPNRLWLTNAEKETIDRSPDFRSGFGSDLQFASLWRYVKDGDYAWEFFSLDGDETRTLDEIVLPTAALLFHELAHAGDFFPPAQIPNIDPNQTTFDASQELRDERISTRLNNEQPLNSDLLTGLALVLFFGSDADNEELALTAEQVGQEFEIDGANDDYSYSTRFEDVAMLFEEVMMKYHFDVDRELAYTDRPEQGASCDEFIIRWGSRHRTGIPLVKARAEFVVRELLNQDDVSEYLAVLPDALLMNTQEPWCTVQDLGPEAEEALDGREIRKQIIPTPIRPDDLLPDYL